MWELDYKESWVSKNWCFWTVVLEKTLESPLDSKEIQPKEVHPKGNQSWIYIGRPDAKAETPILRPPDVKNWLIWCWETLKARGEVDDRGWDGWMALPHSMDMNLSKFWDLLMDREAWHATIHGIIKSWMWLRNWTELNKIFIFI